MDNDMFEWLEGLLADAPQHPKTSDWERSFMNDQAKRVEKYQSDVRMSVKQWAILDRVAEKIGHPERPGT